jgi:MOSC domain-containing protein YiiM/SAM-dependent methyltransferase
MTAPRIAAVLRGTPQPLAPDDPRPTAYRKQRCDAPVRVLRLGIEGDVQFARELHGGPDRALLAYAAAHYPRWRAEGLAVAYGAFGENLVVDGLDEDTVAIGDRFRAGTAVLEVAVPRTPCATIDGATGVAGLCERVRGGGRSGWLLRVIAEGTLGEGDALAREASPHPEWTVRRAAAVYERMRRGERAAADEARALAMLPELAARWREKLLERVADAQAGADELPEHVARNRAAWDGNAPNYVAAGEKRWRAEEPVWGIWAIPESAAGVLPGTLAGKDTLELGCGTGYVSAWLARRGARPVGVDNAPAQLATARRLQREHALLFPVMLGNAEALPVPDASFDVAISEYGASIWADPYRWVPEAARVLRPGGELIFLVNGTLAMLTLPEREADGPAGTTLLRAYFGMHRFEWPDDTSVEFHLGYGDWIRLLRANGFDVEDLIELRPGAEATSRYTYVTLEWARRWPSEQVWKARKRR